MDGLAVEMADLPLDLIEEMPLPAQVRLFLVEIEVRHVRPSRVSEPPPYAFSIDP